MPVISFHLVHIDTTVDRRLAQLLQSRMDKRGSSRCPEICIRSTKPPRHSPWSSTRGATNMKPKNTICLWFNKDAHEAARFYAATLPNSEVTAVRKAPSDYPGGKAGDVLTVEFTVLGVPCLGLNGGPEFRHSEAF